MDNPARRGVDSGRPSLASRRRPAMPQPSLKIDHARYILTLDRQRRIIQDGAILVEDGRISRVGKAADLREARADRTIDARHMVITPGFFNGHMHISYAHPVRGISVSYTHLTLPTS